MDLGGSRVRHLATYVDADAVLLCDGQAVGTYYLYMDPLDNPDKHVKVIDDVKVITEKGNDPDLSSCFTLRDEV